MVVDSRLIELTAWLTDSLSIEIESLLPASQDASFRRYFRLISDSHGFGTDSSLIVMDAPPSQESLTEFICVNQALLASSIHAPYIHAVNQQQGFLILEDLGSRTYLDELMDNSAELYSSALDSLVKIQSMPRTEGGSLDYKSERNLNLNADYIPSQYGALLIEQELDLFKDWYCERHLDVTLSDTQMSEWTKLKDRLVKVFEQQPQTWVHRDFHSRNLMITSKNSPGVIDFQDMVWGPISYDLASVFKDCYIEWPRDTQIHWLEKYLTKLIKLKPKLEIDLRDLIEWFDLTGLQRHLKVLGIFCRLNYRDTKSQYLGDLPLVEKYIDEVLSLYPKLHLFKEVFEELRSHAKNR